MFTSGFPVYGRACKQALHLPYKLRESPAARSNPRPSPVERDASVTGEPPYSGAAAAAVAAGRLTLAQLHPETILLPPFARRQSQCGPRPERWSSPASHAPIINAPSLAKHENRRLNATESRARLLATGINRRRTAAAPALRGFAPLSHHGVVNGVSVSPDPQKRWM